MTPEELERALPIEPPAHRRGGDGCCSSWAFCPARRRTRRPPPAEERPVYTSQDIAGLLTDNEGFRLLIPQTEQQLGKKLRTADLQILAGLYDQIWACRRT